MAFELIRYEVHERIATITLNRPDNMNSYNNQMCKEINMALDLADDDDEVRVVIFTGAEGCKHPTFCAGFDLTVQNPFDFSEAGPCNARDTGGPNALRIYQMRKPVIGAINGSAVGIGITMTLPMDIRILSASAKVGFVFARRGYVNEACSSWFLPRIVGLSKAVEWVATGKIITADEALNSGLVSEVVPQDRVYVRALEIAREIRDNTAPVSVALCRQMMYQMAGARHPMTAHKIESTCFYYIGMSPDALEGAESFMEKRAPQFKMSPVSDMPPVYPWFPDLPFPKNVQDC